MGGKIRVNRRWYRKLVTDYWNPYFALGMAGILSALYFAITGTVWAVTGEFTRFGGHILHLFQIDTSGWAYFDMIGLDGSPFARTDGWIVFGMLFGALITVLLSNNFKVRMPQQKRRLVQGFTGGVIAGFGARLALGCNLAAFFTGVPQFSFHAWIFMVATAFGTFIGVKIVMSKWWRGKPNLKAGKSRLSLKATESSDVTGTNKRSTQPLLGTLVTIVFLAIVVYFVINGQYLLAVAALFGASFGILIERGQICFTSAFRDLWISGRAVMTKAIAVGMIISTVLTFIVVMQPGIDPIIRVAAPSTLIGGLLFGIGIVMAGGCETGMMYRAMEGQVLFWVVGLGNVVGATVLAYGWDHMGIHRLLVEGWPSINLIEAWGAPLALIGTLAILIIWFLFSNWWENNFRYGKGLKTKSEKKVPSSAN